jgi:hypothetical protein
MSFVSHGSLCCCLHQSEYIHFVEGFLLAPGYIDLSQLRFFTIAGDGENNDDFVEPGGDDDIYTAEQNDDEEGDEGDGGGNRRYLDQGDYMMEGSAVDIAVFHLVSNNACMSRPCF